MNYQNLQNFIDVFKDELNHASSILLIIHSDPDPDAIGSVLAMAEYLKSNNKEVYYFSPDQNLPDRFRTLPNATNIKLIKTSELHNLSIDLSILLDIGSETRLDNISKIISKMRSLEIDHHSSNKGLADYSFIDQKSPSCCEILYYMFVGLSFSISSDMAANLMVGINIDSSGFKNYPTSHKTFAAAAELAKICPNYHKYLSRIEGSIDKEGLEVLRQAFDRIEYYFKGKVALVGFSFDEMKKLGISPDETLAQKIKVVNTLKSIKGCALGVYITESEPGKVRATIRCKNPNKYNLLDLSNNLRSGGGHPAAIGLQINKPYELAKDYLTVQFAKTYPKIAADVTTYKKGRSKLHSKASFYNILRNDTLFGEEFLSIIYLDGDYQKDVNKVLGRDAGDQRINQIKSTVLKMAQNLRGIPIEIGGDEFIILLTENIDINNVRSKFSRELKQLSANKLVPNKTLMNFLKVPSVTITQRRVGLPLTPLQIDKLMEEMDTECSRLKIEKYKKLDKDIAKKLTRNYTNQKTSDAINKETYKSKSIKLREDFHLIESEEKVIRKTQIDGSTLLPNKKALIEDSRNWKNMNKMYHFLYFDMVAIKDIHRLFGRETFGVPIILGVYFIINKIGKKYKGDTYRIGGDEGIIIFESESNAKAFLKKIDYVLEHVDLKKWSQGSLLNQKVKDYDKKKYASFDLSKLDKYPKELVACLLPPKVTWVMLSYNQFLSNPSINGSIDNLLNYFESESNRLKKTSYIRLPMSIQNYISRKLF